MRTLTELSRRLLPTLLAAVCLLLSSLNLSAESTRYEIERAGRKAGEAAENAQKTVLCRDMGLNAVRNAMAFHNKAQELLIEAIRSGDSTRIESAWAAADNAAERLEDAWSSLQEIVVWVKEAATAARNASTESDAVLKGDGSLRRVVNYARESAKCALKAVEAADELKAQWLLPPETGGRDAKANDAGRP